MENPWYPSTKSILEGWPKSTRGAERELHITETDTYYIYVKINKLKLREQHSEIVR